MMRLGALLEVAIRPVILRRAAMTSLVVGSLLTLVNHGSVILDRGLAPELVWPILLTYLTPYAVATISSASMVGVGNPTEIERDRP